MKTNNMISTVLKTLTFVVLAFGITNCNKGNNNNANYGYGMVNGYRIVNNICYQSYNGISTPVANNACPANTPMYQMNGNVCNQVVNGQYIPQPNPALCSANGSAYGVNGACAPQMINGQYVQQPNCNPGMNGMYGVNGMNGMNGAYNTVTQTCYGSYYHAQYGNVNCGTQYYCQGPGFTNQYGQPVICQ